MRVAVVYGVGDRTIRRVETRDNDGDLDGLLLANDESCSLINQSFYALYATENDLAVALGLNGNAA